MPFVPFVRDVLFQHTAARRRLQGYHSRIIERGWVSTHSRPKAAANQTPPFGRGRKRFQHTAARRRLHLSIVVVVNALCLFQHTAARRRLRQKIVSTPILTAEFQHTAARRRLLAVFPNSNPPLGVSTHSRPKAAADTNGPGYKKYNVSTHSRPKAAALILMFILR